MDIVVVALPGEYHYRECGIEYIFNQDQYEEFKKKKLMKLTRRHNQCKKYGYKNCYCEKDYFVYFTKLGEYIDLSNPQKIKINGYKGKIC